MLVGCGWCLTLSPRSGLASSKEEVFCQKFLPKYGAQGRGKKSGVVGWALRGAAGSGQYLT